MPCTPSSPQMPGPRCPSLGHSLLCCQAPGQGKDFPQGWAPLHCLRPCRTWGCCGQDQTGAHTHLVPAISAPLVTLPGWRGDGSQGPIQGSGAVSHPAWPQARASSPPYGAPGRLPARGRCSCRDHTKPHCRLSRGFPEAFPPRAGPVPAPALPGNGSASRARPPPPLGALEDAARTVRVPLLSPALLGGLCHPAAEVLMVLCPAFHYFPECQGHVLASGAGCDPAEPDAAAAAWGANGRSTPHVEFNYWLSSSTEYIG